MVNTVKRDFPVNIFFLLQPMMLLTLCLFFYVQSIGSLFTPSSFAVDSSNRVYIEAVGRIRVFEPDGSERSISVTNRGYFFTILDGNTLVYSNGSITKRFDLAEGLPSSSAEAVSAVPSAEDVDILHRTREFVDEEGNVFTLRHSWGRYRIEKNNDIVFLMPLSDYLVSTFAALFYSAMLLVLGIMLYTHYNKKA